LVEGLAAAVPIRGNYFRGDLAKAMTSAGSWSAASVWNNQSQPVDFPPQRAQWIKDARHCID